MEIFDGHRALFRPLFSPAMAIGNFDGVHRGHQQLISETVAAASRLGGDALVLTFEPHPARILAPERAPEILTTRERKLELIAGLGISACIVEPFTRELSELTPEEFVRSILIDVIRVRHVVVGYDFVFGKDRAGNTDTLRALAREHDFELQVIDPVEVAERVASSSRVRSLLREGDVARVAALLGREHDVDGTVVPGDGRGRTIGVPTANIDPDETMMPASGVYAVRLRVLGSGNPFAETQPDLPDRALALPGVANLGVRPTFDAGQRRTLEVHVLDFDADLYGARVRVEFVERLRAEQRFPGVDALVAQIRDDIARARALFSRPSLS